MEDQAMEAAEERGDATIVIDFDARTVSLTSHQDDVEELFRDVAMTLDDEQNNQITLSVARVSAVKPDRVEEMISAGITSADDLMLETDAASVDEEDTAEFSAARNAEPDPVPAAEPVPAPAARPKPTPAARQPRTPAKPAPAPRQ